MTDGSDPAAPPEMPGELQGPPLPPAVATPPAAPAPVLARGHLHPAILLLRLLDAIQRAVVPLLLGVLVDRFFLVLAGILFLLQLGLQVARYITLEYTLTADELRIREGLLERQERRIPLDRIQDLGFESTLLRRALGLVVVLVETASGRGVEAQLDALSRGDAEHLREVLLAARRTAPAGAAAGAGDPTAPTPPLPGPEPEWLVHRSTATDLLLRGLTDLRLSAFVVTGFAALQLADQFGFAARLRGLGSGVLEWLGHFPTPILVLVLALLVFAALAFGVVTTTIGNLVQFHGFTLALRGDVLQRRFGLLTTRQKVLPRARIQRVTVEQPWLRRLLGYAVVKADSAGGSRAQGEDNASGWDVVVPLAALPVAEARLPALLPGLELEHFAWRRGSARLVVRTTLQGALLAAVTIAGAWPGAGAWALLAAALVPLWAVLGVLVWRNLGFAAGERFFALRFGVVGRYAAYVPTAKVQAVVVQQGPLDQVLGLAGLTVYVAGGSPSRLPDLLLADAHELAGELAARAATAAATER